MCIYVVHSPLIGVTNICEHIVASVGMAVLNAVSLMSVLALQYRTTRNALAPDPSASTMGASSLGASAMLGASRVVDSDSDDEFPGSVAGSDHEGDDSSVDSDDFQDALARKPVTRVKMGEARRSALKGSTLRVSTYG